MALARTDLLGADTNWTAGTFGTGAFVTGSFTPPNNSLLVVCLEINANASGDPTANISVAGGSLSYTRQQINVSPSQFACTVIWTAPVSTGSSMTLTLDCGAQDIAWYIVRAVAYTGYDTSTPVSGAGGTASLAGGTTISATLSASPTVNDEVIAIGGVDSLVGVSVGSGFTQILSTYNNANMSNSSISEIRTSSTSNSFSFGIGSSGVDCALSGIIVQAATAAPTPTTAGYFIEDTALQRKPQTQRMLAADPQFATPFQPANDNPNVSQPTVAGVIKTRMIPC